MLLNKNDAPQFERGVWPDLGNDAAPLIVDARNVRFDIGQISPVPGAKLVLNTNQRERIRAMYSQFAFERPRIWIAFHETIWSLDESSFTQRSTIDNALAFAAFGNFTLMVNGGQLHARRSAVTGFAVVADSPDNVRFVVVAGPQVLLFGERTIYWCGLDDIDDWAYSDPDSLAGLLFIRDMDSDIAAVIPYMNGAAVFSAGGLWSVQRTGTDSVFGISKLQAKVGCVGREAVCLAKGLFYGLAKEQVWVSDGVTHDSIDNPMFHDKLFRDLIEPSRISESVVWYDAANDRIVVNFPAKGTQEEFDGAAWNLSSRNWSPLTTGYCVVDRGSAWPNQLLGTVDGYVFGQGTQVLAPTVAFRNGMTTRRIARIGWSYGLFPYGAAPYAGWVVAEPFPTTRSTATVTMTFVPEGGGPEQTLDVVQEGLADEAWVETRDMDFGSDDLKYVDQIVMKLEGAATLGSLFLRYATKDRLKDPIVWSERIPLLNVDEPIELRETARYFRVRLEDDFVRGRWKLTGISWFGKPVGGRM